MYMAHPRPLIDIQCIPHPRCLTHPPWHLYIAPDASEFYLTDDDNHILYAQLKLVIDEQPHPLDQLNWATRTHTDTYEIWSFNNDQQFSAGIVFHLSAEQLVIDYFARLTTPSKIVFQHQLTEYPESIDQGSPFSFSEQAYHLNTMHSQFSRIPENFYISDNFAASFTISLCDNVT